MLRLMLILVPVLLLSGCKNPSGIEIPKIQTITVDTGCKWVHPIYIGNADRLTEETARQIEVHNETWEVNCGEGTGSDPSYGK